MNRIVAVSVLALLLQACYKAPEPPVPAVQAASTAIAWVKPEGTNIDPIFAQARAANKPVFLYWGSSVVPAVQPDQGHRLQPQGLH